MFQLKDFQQKALERLQEYFEEVRNVDSPATAFENITEHYYGEKLQYRIIKDSQEKVISELEDPPYVCFRIPTGGGKTLVACHTISTAQKEFMFSDRSMVLWLVPTNPIKDQTLKALRNPQHPYRQALDFELGTVNILNIGDALHINRSTLLSGTTIIVSTIQAFRVEEQDGRKVYEQNGHLKEHFTNIQANLFEGIDLNPEGKPLESLANLIRIHRPIVIVDEAHNARTDLSFSTLAKFEPSCILEFTATPQTDSRLRPSNILYTASASELSSENMIKMPIWLETQPDWERLLADAIQRLNNLQSQTDDEKIKSGEYIRPIMLLQAQPRSQTRDTLTAEVVKKALVEIFKIPEAEVVIAIGDKDELGDTDLSDPNCPIRFIVTVKKLKEGWDCPFAYVLCSVAEISSGTSIEQIIGRVLRLPNVKEKHNTDLNRAYAYVGSPNFNIVLNRMKDAVIQNGFNDQDAEDLVQYHQREQQEEIDYGDMPLFGQQVVSMQYDGEFNSDQLPKELKAKVAQNETTKTIILTSALTIEQKESLKTCLQAEEDQSKVEKLFINSLSIENISPAEAGIDFSIPVLSIKQGEIFETFEKGHLLDYEWSLIKCKSELSETDFSQPKSDAETGEIFYAKGKVLSRFLGRLDQQVEAIFPDLNQSVANLVNWLDRNFEHQDIPKNETDIFITGVINYLMNSRGFSLEGLYFDRFNLLKAVRDKIAFYRNQVQKNAHQELLFSGKHEVKVSPERVFSFDRNSAHYPVNNPYVGNHKFNNHYYPKIGDLNNEELLCAQYIDNLDEVLFWVRNIERKESFSFWLQTSTDKFYPDFICKLKDGRILVVEYKGEGRWTEDDSKEKRDLGELWEKRSDGKCLFIMPRGKDFKAIEQKIKSI